MPLVGHVVDENRLPGPGTNCRDEQQTFGKLWLLDEFLVGVGLQEKLTNVAQVQTGAGECLCHLPLDEGVFDDVVQACDARLLRCGEHAVVGEEDVGDFMIHEALDGVEQLVAGVVRDVWDIHPQRTARVGILDEGASAALGDFDFLLSEHLDDPHRRFSHDNYAVTHSAFPPASAASDIKSA